MYKFVSILIILISCTTTRNDNTSKSSSNTIDDCDSLGYYYSKNHKDNCFYMPDHNLFKQPVLKYSFKDGSKILLYQSEGNILNNKKALFDRFNIINNISCEEIESFFGAFSKWIVEINIDSIDITEHITLPFGRNWEYSKLPFIKCSLVSSNNKPYISNKILLLTIMPNNTSLFSSLKHKLKRFKNIDFYSNNNKTIDIHSILENEFLPRLLVCSMHGDKDCEYILNNITTYFNKWHFTEGAYAESALYYQHTLSQYKALLK